MNPDKAIGKDLAAPMRVASMAMGMKMKDVANRLDVNMEKSKTVTSKMPETGVDRNPLVKIPFLRFTITISANVRVMHTRQKNKNHELGIDIFLMPLVSLGKRGAIKCMPLKQLRFENIRAAHITTGAQQNSILFPYRR